MVIPFLSSYSLLILGYSSHFSQSFRLFKWNFLPCKRIFRYEPAHEKSTNLVRLVPPFPVSFLRLRPVAGCHIEGHGQDEDGPFHHVLEGDVHTQEVHAIGQGHDY